LGNFYQFDSLYLKPKMPLISAEEPLPPRGDMREYLAPDSRLFFSFIEVVLRLKVLVTFKENLPLSLFLRKLR
jgi:hypothetical protein